MRRIIEILILFEEFEEICCWSGIRVRLVFFEVIVKNRILFKRVVIEGEDEEIKRFMEFLMRVRVGG